MARLRLIAVLRRYWDTVRYLRPVQFYGRLKRQLLRPKLDCSAPPDVRKHNGLWQRTADRLPSLVGPEEFLFLGIRGSLNQIGWEGPERERLWRYNQHYFDDLNARDYALRGSWHSALIEDWMMNNEAGSGTGWEPYPTSLRIVNWIKWAIVSDSLPTRFHESLATQVRWLSCCLETHLLGNHLIANAKALIYAGRYFEGSEADRWHRLGAGLLAREIDEQVLSDGGHFERSPMYHLIVTEDLLDVINLYRSTSLPIPESWSAAVLKMLACSRVMRHPDGEIPLFNDAAFDIAPTPTAIDEYAARLELPESDVAQEGEDAVYLESSGYARLQSESATLFVDLAAIGPDYLPGHAHADTLSFELSLGTNRIVVNGGTSEYGTGPERQRQRSTSAHSTVVIDGLDSSEVWSGFRVGRRARVRSARVLRNSDGLAATGEHDGYRFLPGKPIHRRTWVLGAGRLGITDEFLGSGHHRMDTYFQLAPDLTPEVSKEGIRVMREGSEVLRILLDSPIVDSVRLEKTTWHPRFGQSLPAWCIRLERNCRLPAERLIRFHWGQT